MLSKVFWNLGGQALPMIIGVLATPSLIFRLGDDRFGLLAIAWVVVGYLSLFDFGIGRAMTRQLAVRIGLGQEDSYGRVFWSAILAMFAFGAVGTCLGVLSADYLATGFLTVPRWLQSEARNALMVLSFGIPVTIISTGLRGVLEAFQDFRRVGVIRFLNGLTTFLVPLAVVFTTRNIAVIAAALVLARLGIAIINALMCARSSPATVKWQSPSLAELRELISVGGWMTVSNVISPIMSSLDRFLLGSLLTVGAITYYATPFDVVTKLLILPAALAGVLFPAFATSYKSNSTRTHVLFNRSWDTTFFVTFPFVFVTALLARPGLELWLNDEFAVRSTVIVQWLAFGVLANSLAQMPYTLLQARGQSRAVALIHLLELPFYIGMLYLLVLRFGVLGAAIAWTFRVSFDLVVMLLVAMKSTGGWDGSLGRTWNLQAVLIALMIAGSVLEREVIAVGAILVVGVSLSGVLLLRELAPQLRRLGFLREYPNSVP